MRHMIRFAEVVVLGLYLGTVTFVDVQAAVRTANWIGGASGNYSNPANWDLGGADIPINNLADSFFVTIPASSTVNFDVVGSGHRVSQLTLAASSTLNMNPGRDLEVLDSAAISGVVSANNSTFLANHASSTLGGAAARLLASGGGDISHAATAYNATGISNGVILGADGTGTTLTLAALQTITATNDPFGGNVRSISATNLGAISLPALLKVDCPGGDDRFDFVSTGGGTIVLSSLNTLTGNVRFQTDAATLNLNTLTSAQGMTFAVPVGATVNLNALASQSGGSYSLTGGETFNLAALTTLENAVVVFSGASGVLNAPLLNKIDNTRFMLSGGAVKTLAVQPTYTITGLGNATVMSAADSGTSLTASTIQTLVATNDVFGANTRTFSAASGGTINLSGLATINGPGGDDKVEFASNTGGTINLSGLSTITGNVRFTSDATSYSLPALTNAGAISFGLSAGAVLNLPELIVQNGGSYAVPAAGRVNLPKLTTLNNNTVTIGGGGVFDAPLLTDISGSFLTLGPGQTFNTSALNAVDNARIALVGGVSLAVADSAYINSTLDSGDIFSADGAGTTLNLSSVTSLSSTQNPFGAHRRNIRATAGGTVNLANLTTLAGPSGDDRIDLITATGGTINLSNLQNITTGNFLFQSDAATFSLPKLTHAAAMSFALPNGVTLNLPELLDQVGGGYDLPVAASFNLPKLTSLTAATIAINQASSTWNAPNLTNINDTRISLANGATLNVAANAYTANGLGTATPMSATGLGTELDASSIATIDSSANPFGANVRSFTATSNGRIDLSSVTQVLAPTGDDRLDFLASGGGVLDMSRLQTIANGNTRFVASTGGRIHLGGLTSTASMNLSADGNASLITAQYLHLSATASFGLTAAAKLELTGSFTHALTSESAFNADTGIVQMRGDGTRYFEVAGTDAGAINATNNFGLAQLIVGSNSTKTDLILTDFFDNGNRASSEALYLLGSGGLDGLQILNKSTLRIGSVPVYALIGGVMTELHSLFQPNQLFVHYTNYGSDGFIIIGDPLLAGDYNNDGTVDAADYVVWREYLGTLYTTGHHAIWRQNYGNTANGTGSGIDNLVSHVSIPEPVGGWLILVGAVSVALPRRRLKRLPV